MIHGVFGKLGSGKGLGVMDIIAKELLEGFRDVVTNVPLRIEPWVNGQGLAQIGLRSYLVEKLGGDDSLVDEMLRRVLVIEDIDKGSDLFLWRRDGDTGEWFKLTITKEDDKGRPERFDGEEIKRRKTAPCLVVTDEAWQFYPNNGGFSRAPVLAFYSRQQRKLRDEWYIVTQHPTDCDSVLWNIAQDFWVCRNHGMERMGIFRQPPMFRVLVYLTNPAKGNAIRSQEYYRFLDKKLSQCYDTTAGVGISGGFKGDANQKKKGLSIVWLGVAIALFVAALMATPFLFRFAAKGFFFKTLSGGAVNEQGQHVTNTPALLGVPVKTQASSSPRPGTIAPDTQTNATFCVGYVIPAALGGPCAFMSDGSTAYPPELTKIERTRVQCSGKWYPVRFRQPEQTTFQSSPSVVEVNPDYSPSVMPGHSSPVVYTFGTRSVISPPPRLNGFAAMAGRP